MLQKALPRSLKILQSIALIAAFALLAGLLSSLALGQSPVRDRITQDVLPGATAALPGTVNPRANPAFDIGRADPSTRLTGMTMTSSRPQRSRPRSTIFCSSSRRPARRSTINGLRPHSTPASSAFPPTISPRFRHGSSNRGFLSTASRTAATQFHFQEQSRR